MRAHRILFLCTGNSCRSQMAEGWARTLHGDKVDVISAGIDAHGLNPMAVRVMAEAGVDISRQISRRVADLPAQELDLVVTVCDHAREVCPSFSGATRVIHQSFDDPPELAVLKGCEEDQLEIYRRVRDEIREFVNGLTALLDRPPHD